MAISARDSLQAGLMAWERAKRGEQPIVSDAMLNALGDHFQDTDCQDGSDYFRYTSTIHNPNRVGILDAYVLRMDRR
jgi:hypothetical protein